MSRDRNRALAAWKRIQKILGSGDHYLSLSDQERKEIEYDLDILFHVLNKPDVEAQIRSAGLGRC